MIKIKEASGAKWNMFGEIDPRLGIIFYDATGYLKSKGYDDIVITSIIRPKKGDSGIHALGRAIDFVVSNISSEDIDDFLNTFNTLYQYDYNRMALDTLIYHSTDAYGDAGYHFHLQVMPW